MLRNTSHDDFNRRFGEPGWSVDVPFVCNTAVDFDRADVVVIGAGLTGLAAAEALALRGKKVLVIDRQGVGSGASGRNAGFCTISPSATARSVLLQYGEVSGKKYFDWFLRAAERVRERAEEDFSDIEWSQNGRASLALSAKQAESMRENWSIQHKLFKLPVQYLSRSEVERVAGGGSYYAAITDNVSGSLNPLKLVHSLALHARNAGACICEGVEATSVREVGSKVYIDCGSITLEANEVIIATDAYRSLQNTRTAGLYVPLASYMIATESLSEEVCSLLFPDKRVASTSRNFANYFRIDARRRLLFGGRRTLSSNTPLSDIASELHDAAGKLFDSVHIPNVDKCWGGLLSFTQDRTPVVGGLSERIYYAGGYCGHGVPTALACGEMLAERILGADAVDCPFYQSRLKGSVKMQMAKVLLPAISRYYRAVDAIN
ncbi:NAD(P)/FAD-dependent oxidoreductase [Paraburkholderia caribensis]|uniref:NAD(P)/FAD-dependent oxidoreductase n=1 Tax=Paraburkholderia caribensis TaxID=75105 RepID=UPI0018D3413B|nr:FAD-dependent oxidoreductase [Paraburkholderia caribensis]